MSQPILTEQDIRRALTRVAHEILERNKGAKDLILVGIRTRGVDLARRLIQKIKEIEDLTIPMGVLDITLYRDDIDQNEISPTALSEFEKKTILPESINGKVVILIDDVFYTGRTIRAAIEVLMKMGRPAGVQLAILIDRGHRELPFKADFIGKNIPTSKSQVVKVRLKETDDADGVFVFSNSELKVKA